MFYTASWCFIRGLEVGTISGNGNTLETKQPKKDTYKNALSQFAYHLSLSIHKYNIHLTVLLKIEWVLLNKLSDILSDVQFSLCCEKHTV